MARQLLSLRSPVVRPKVKPTTKYVEFASHLPETLAYHARILADKPRVDALRRAVEFYVNQETEFLDVGSGTGIWAILAAKLGAKRVVAVEMEESLIPLIYKHAQESGVAESIEIIHGNVDDIKLKGTFNVIVGELFGADVFGYKTTNSFINLRKKFLAPDGVIIPQWVRLLAVPLISRRGSAYNLDQLPVSTDYLNALRMNYGKLTTLEDRKNFEFAGDPKLLVDIDYLSIDEPAKTAAAIVEWQTKNLSQINSIMTFSVLQYAPGIELNSLESSTWILERYDFVPFEIDEGSIRFEIKFDPNGSSWTISVPSHPEMRPQTYSPVFGFTRAKMAHAVTPYKSFRSRRTRSKA